MKFDFMKPSLELENNLRYWAHDVRAPLAAIRAIADCSPLEMNDRKVFLRAIDRIVSMTEQLLQSYKNQMIGEDFISGTTNVIAEKNLTKNIRVELIHDEAKSQPIAMDLLTYQRILSNIIDNALEASAPGHTVKVQIKFDNLGAQVQVVDTGKGMDPSLLSLLTSKGGTFGKTNGHGLGLKFTREVLETVGGTLKIHSELGKGTNVLIWIPYV